MFSIARRTIRGAPAPAVSLVLSCGISCCDRSASHLTGGRGSRVRLGVGEKRIKCKCSLLWSPFDP
eukprot:9480257-Pyramimonas_sp.AAC.2